MGLFNLFKKSKEEKIKTKNQIKNNKIYEENDVWSLGPNPPDDKRKFWIDTDPLYGGLKIYICGEWVPMRLSYCNKHQEILYDEINNIESIRDELNNILSDKEED